MIDKKFIGYDIGSHNVDVEKGRLKLFNKVIGQTNPIYCDEAKAIEAGYPGLPVPPTFYFSIDFEQPDPFDWFEEVGIDLVRLLHGEQEFKYHAQAFAGDSLHISAKVGDIYSKKNGALDFVIKEVTIIREDGQLIATLKSTLIIRNEVA